MLSPLGHLVHANANAIAIAIAIVIDEG